VKKFCKSIKNWQSLRWHVFWLTVYSLREVSETKCHTVSHILVECIESLKLFTSSVIPGLQLRPDDVSVIVHWPHSTWYYCTHFDANCCLLTPVYTLPSSRNIRNIQYYFITTITTKLHNNLVQVVHTYVPLSPSSITWYWSKDGDVLRLGRWPQARQKVMAAYRWRMT